MFFADRIRQVKDVTKLLSDRITSTDCPKRWRGLFHLVRWLRVILRLDRYRVEESMKFATKNLVGIRSKFSLGAT